MTYIILQGNCLDVLKTIPSSLVQTCVTSPPYFGLRDYGTATWEGGSPECSHRPDDTPTLRGIASSTLGGGKNHTGHKQEGFGRECPRCSAKRIDSQIGLEATPQSYVESLVQVFREVRRTLRDDGTLWLNLGDSYVSAPKGNPGARGNINGGKRDNADADRGSTIDKSKLPGLKPKDLIGIPWRVAFALQQDGWYLRQDIIWHKPNPMPESVRDRCTKAHEYLFLLSKSEKYFFDNDAIREPITSTDPRNRRTPASVANEQMRSSELESFGLTRGKTNQPCSHPLGKNKRSVWTVSPKPFKEAHFATFPPDLIRPCILAGAPKGKLVLDPFGGAGTTALVSEQLGRHSISIELNPDYVTMARARVEARSPK